MVYHQVTILYYPNFYLYIGIYKSFFPEFSSTSTFIKMTFSILLVRNHR